MKLILLFLLIPFQIQATVFTQAQWTQFYLRDCATLEDNRACKGDLEQILGRMVNYSEMAFKYLDKQDLPRWLIAVPVVESAYNPKAVSKMKALGLWQIMPYNIREYKTRKVVILNRSIEIIPTTEKIRKYGFDPETNTQIAAQHFRMLFEKFRHHKDTEKLALLAYNCGVSRVKRWLIGQSKLPTETQNYYNKIMAVKYIIRNMKELGVKPVRQLSFIDRIKEWM